MFNTKEERYKFNTHLNLWLSVTMIHYPDIDKYYTKCPKKIKLQEAVLLLSKCICYVMLWKTSEYFVFVSDDVPTSTLNWYYVCKQTPDNRVEYEFIFPFEVVHVQ